MKAERWSEVRRLTEEALDCEAVERAAFVARRCGDDAELRQEVEALLAADAEPDGRLDTPAVLAPVLPPALPPGTRLGPWELGAEIASGGMGTVYRAARADAAFEKEVAIKVVKRGLDTEEVLRRFAFERRLLAGLEHPHIARLLDAGSTEAGRPWLAMELVSGHPIDQHCEREALDIRARLELFRKVCAAVEHAHRHLVVHRDLKPGNILVTAEGEPKLVDFGIAKVLDPSVSPGATPTLGTSQALTPDYASLEQLRGEPISTSTDVYSLGVVLYELLTGRRPFRLAGLARAEAERMLQESKPELPSTIVDDPVRRAALKGDVDTIVLAALHSDPACRYGSAAELTEDLRRHLEGLPVLARLDSLPYIARRFVARHQLAVGGSVLLVLSLAIGFAVSWSLYTETRALAESLDAERGRTQQRYEETRELAASLEVERERTQIRYLETLELAGSLERERGRAEARFDDVRELANTLLREMNSALAPVLGSTRARELLVETGLSYLERLGADTGDDPDLLKDIGWGHLAIANLQGGANVSNLGRTLEAADSAAQARSLGEELTAGYPDDDEAALLLAQAIVTQVELDVVMGRGVRPADFEQALAVCPDPDAMGELAGRTHALVARIHEALGQAEYSRGNHYAAHDHYAVAVENARAFTALSADERLVPDLATSLGWLALFEAWTGRSAAAEEHVAEAIERLEPLVERDPTNRILLRALSFCCSQQGKIFVALDRHDEAIVTFLRTLAMSEALAASDPDDRSALRDLMIVHANLLQPYVIAERLGDALHSARRWTEIAEQLAAADEDSERARRDLAQARSGLARALGANGRAEEALRLGKQALDVWRGLADRNPRDVSAQHNTVATAWDAGKAASSLARTTDDEPERRTRFAQALGFFREAHDRMAGLADAGHLIASDAPFLDRIGDDLRRCEEALAALDRVGTGP